MDQNLSNRQYNRTEGKFSGDENVKLVVWRNERG